MSDESIDSVMFIGNKEMVPLEFLLKFAMMEGCMIQEEKRDE